MKYEESGFSALFIGAALLAAGLCFGGMFLGPSVARAVLAGILVLLAVLAVSFFLTRSRMRETRARLETMAITDEMTGVYNRRHLYKRFEEEFQEHRRQGTEMGCILVDLDRLRSINETHGHRTGDAVLKEFARVIRACTRVYDILGRYGGEEFMILLPLTGLLHAMAFAERVRKTIERDFAVTGPSGESVKLTISLGVSNLRVGDSSIDVVAKRADEALLKAKKSGRNRAELA
jgi:two-component system cell cycle response regulator